MSEISNKAIIIAVSLLVTIAIASSIIMVLGYFKDIYKIVDETDISLRKMFNEFDMYDNTTLTGLEIINAYNKYRDNPLVNFTLKGINLKENLVWFSELINTEEKEASFYAEKYSSTCERVGDGANITFTRK